MGEAREGEFFYIVFFCCSDHSIEIDPIYTTSPFLIFYSSLRRLLKHC